MNCREPAMSDPNSKVSIIIPVYNTYAFLEECVLSALSQTHRNIEIILIDDGSTDGSEKLCDKLQKTDTRIHSYHQSNRGVSSARNTGLSHASGSFIMFLDSDDVIAPLTVETTYTSIKRSKCEIGVFGLTYRRDQMHSKTFNEKDMMKDIRLLTANYAMSHILYSRSGITSGVTGKMFSRDLIENMEFINTIHIAEDTLFLITALSRATNICVVPQRLYYYRARPGSAMMSTFSPKRMTALKAFENILNIPELNEDNRDATKIRLFVEAVNVLQLLPTNINYYVYRTKCIAIIEQYRAHAALDSGSRPIHRFYGLVAMLGVTPMLIIVKTIRRIKHIKKG